MNDLGKFYSDGKWQKPASHVSQDIINPSNGFPSGRVAMGNDEDVDRAVAAARKAFPSFSQTSRADRIELLDRVIAEYEKRMDDFARAITLELGAPKDFSQNVQAPSGLSHLVSARDILKTFLFEENIDTTRVLKEPIGVVAMITPWNWPVNQITCKVAPALATGCTMVLKPSEITPYCAQIFAEVMDAAGVPAGVFNMIYGDGATAGEALSGHKDVDMVSFTGSTRAGARVQANAAATIKRVTQELGGKSANILLDDADFKSVVRRDTYGVMRNTGQTCTLWSRMLVPEDRMDEVIEIARSAANSVVSGNPTADGVTMGPIAHKAQYEKVQSLIQTAIDEGAELVSGGVGLPDGLASADQKGYYVKPTVFARVTLDMTIAREEVFGPVLAIIGYKDEEDAVRIANDTPYGLSGAVSTGSLERGQAVARRLRTGMVHINGAPLDIRVPFGGYKQSGNGREWGIHAFNEYLEVKSVLGYDAA